MGYWLLVIGYWLLVIGYWLWVISYGLLVIGYWLLVIGCLLSLVPRLCLGTQIQRLCLAFNHTIEAEPLDLGSQAEPGNQCTSAFPIPYSLFPIPYSPLRVNPSVYTQQWWQFYPYLFFAKIQFASNKVRTHPQSFEYPLLWKLPGFLNPLDHH